MADRRMMEIDTAFRVLTNLIEDEKTDFLSRNDVRRLTGQLLGVKSEIHRIDKEVSE